MSCFQNEMSGVCDQFDLLAGISAGTNVFAALKLARRLGPGKTVVTILPDTAERYFSTPLFDEGESPEA